MGIFVVALVVAVVLALAYYFSEGRDDGVNTVVVAVRGYVSVEQREALKSQLSGYQEESESVISLDVYEFPAAGDLTGKSPLTALLTTIRDGKSDLFIVDDYVYSQIGGEALFEDLSVRYPGDPAVIGQDRYALAGKPVVNALGLEGLPRMYLLLRRADSPTVNHDAQSVGNYEEQSALLDNIVNSTPLPEHASRSMDL